MFAEARQITNDMPPQLMAVFMEEINKNGFASAISFCRDKTPAMTKVPWKKLAGTCAVSVNRILTSRQFPMTGKALSTQSLCLNCHDQVDKLHCDVRKVLKELYPDDRATDYEVGQLRGAISTNFLKLAISNIIVLT